jgi:hypothetical protein
LGDRSRASHEFDASLGVFDRLAFHREFEVLKLGADLQRADAVGGRAQAELAAGAGLDDARSVAFKGGVDVERSQPRLARSKRPVRSFQGSGFDADRAAVRQNDLGVAEPELSRPMVPFPGQPMWSSSRLTAGK